MNVQLDKRTMPRNYKDLFAICKKHGFNYKDKVAEFTAQCREVPTDSLRSLTDGEYREFMLQMKRLNEPMRQIFTPKAGDKQRKKMLTLAGKMQWGATMPQLVKAVDAWCLKQKYKRGFMQLDVYELNVLVTILENEVLPSFYTGFNK